MRRKLFYIPILIVLLSFFACEPLPFANFGTEEFIGDVYITEGESVNFVDKSTGEPSEYHWEFTGGSPSASYDQNPTVTYDYAGTFDVTLKVTNNQGSNTTTKTAFVHVEPGMIADFSAQGNTTITAGQAVNFLDASTADNITAWSWQFEGGTPSTSNNQNPGVLYNTAGTFDVTLTIYSGTDTRTITKENYITVIEQDKEIVFWTSDNLNNIVFYDGIGNVQGNVTQSFTNTPTCGSTGCYTASAASGVQFNYIAENTLRTWEGSITPNADCFPYELNADNATSDETLTFWTTESYVLADPFTINIDNVELGQITEKYDTEPDCNASGCVNLANIKQGSFNFTISSVNGDIDGTVNVDVLDGCNLYEIYIDKANNLFKVRPSNKIVQR